MSNTPRSPPANDFDYDDVTIGKTLLDSCRRRSLRRRRPVVLSVVSVMIGRRDPLFAHLVHKFRAPKKIRDTPLKVNRLGLSWSDKESRLSLCQAEIRKHEFQADHDRRSIQKLNETIESQKEEICRAHQGDERRRQDQQLLHEQLLKQNWIFVKLMRKASVKWKT